MARACAVGPTPVAVHGRRLAPRRAGSASNLPHQGPEPLEHDQVGQHGGWGRSCLAEPGRLVERE